MWDRKDCQYKGSGAKRPQFPANIPAERLGDCLRVFKAENGLIIEIADELIQLATKVGLAVELVIWLSSPLNWPMS
jgi:hypothetical protein